MTSIYKQNRCSAIISVISLISMFLAVNAHAQTVSYIIPDIGTPDMNTYVEIIAPYNANGTFSGGSYFNNPGDAVRVQCVNPDDTNKVTIGPLVVSWDGRMISTQIFVHPDVTPNSTLWSSLDPEYIIQLEVVVNNTPGNSFPFYIVNPMPAIVASGSGTFGAGGNMGIRSSRGAMIVDSIDLGDGLYTVSSDDTDPATDGNQGYLPVTIISKGPVRGTTAAQLSLTSGTLHAAPGGGGGGGAFCDFSGDGGNGGNGYTGGGRGGRNGSGVRPDIYKDPGSGTGTTSGGVSFGLNGIPGGSSPWYEASGGGTGHPFGRSGEGCADGDNCSPDGGYGAGSGASQDVDGAGAGYATEGTSSRGTNGGHVHGNAQLVPLAGGSGGASGNPEGISQCSGEGGAGGGAIRIYGSSISNIQILADGGTGQTYSEASGGSGSGGGIIAESKLHTNPLKLSALQGQGNRPGGSGRLRIDGPVTNVQLEPSTASYYRGHSTDTTKFVDQTFTLTGTGNGNDIFVFIRSERTPWYLYATVSGYLMNSWSVPITLPGDANLYYIATAQTQPSPTSDLYTAVPEFVFSQAAANIVHYNPAPAIAADTTLEISLLLCEDTATATVFIRNEGTGTLDLTNAQFSIPGLRIAQPTFPVSIAPNDSVALVIEADTTGGAGTQTGILLLTNNDPAPGKNPFSIHITVIREDANFDIDPAVIDFGTVACVAYIDTVIDLRNTGTVAIDLVQALSTNTGITVLEPATLPLTLQPSETLPVRIRLQGIPGTDSSQIQFALSSAYCDLARTAYIQWTWDDISYAVSDLSLAGHVLCPGDYHDTVFTVYNTGSAAITLEDSGFTDSQFTVIAPAFPVTIASGDSVEITLRYTGNIAGATQAVWNLHVLPCDVIHQQQLEGILETLSASANDVHFGVRNSTALPLTDTVMVHNNGTLPVELTAALFPQSQPFRVLSGIPGTIPAGDSAIVVVEFFDPGYDSSWMVQVELAIDPSCDPLFITMTGARGEASVVLEIGSAQAAAGDLVTIPVYLRNAKNLDFYGATGIATELRYNASILAPLFTPSGNIVNEERIIPLTLPVTTDANEVAMTLAFRAMLGTVEQTALTPQNSVAIGGDITITEMPGVFSLTDVCHEGGDRFFYDTQAMQLAQNVPNPFNAVTRISYTVIESGWVSLAVYDRLGRRVRTLVDMHREPGTYEVYFDANTLSSGTYRYVLQTPTMSTMRTMMLVK